MIYKRFLIFIFFPIILHAEEKLYLYSENYATPHGKEINFQFRIDYDRRADINNIQQWTGLEGGITDNLTISAFGIMTYGIDDNRMFADSFYAGIEYRIGDKGKLPVDAGLTFGYLQETGGIPVLKAGGIISKDFGNLNLTSNLLFEKAFQKMRDEIDMFITAGISMKVNEWLRTGLEYEGLDLEDLWEKEEAEGGAQHIMGPVAAFRFNEGRTQFLFTPSALFSPLEDGFIIRAMFAQTF